MGSGVGTQGRMLQKHYTSKHPIRALNYARYSVKSSAKHYI